MSDKSISETAVIIERTFDAPIELVWKLWTQAEHFKNWFGPRSFTIPVAEMDVRVGGKRIICMEQETSNGVMTMWFAGEYTEVNPYTRLVYTDGFADENGTPVAPPDDSHPQRSVVTVELEDLGERTRMVMSHADLPGDPQSQQGAKYGWGQSFDKLAEYATSL